MKLLSIDALHRDNIGLKHSPELTAEELIRCVHPTSNQPLKIVRSGTPMPTVAEAS
jgi:hypothetical protein